MNLFRLLLDAADPAATVSPSEASAEMAANPMEGMLQMLDLFMMAMLFAAGIYGLYAAIKLHRTCMLFPSKMLYPGDCSVADCLDAEGFMDYIFPRLMTLSILLILEAVAFIVCRVVFKLDSTVFDICFIVLPLATLGWYMFVQRRCAKLFWGK